ncbi:ATP-binding protein [Acetohalobium arabaticum]|uniref:4Fe-4S ferredoxin iron-sulfur binding domain protein n=1 Tax=Acetohalobium arabaticum (strain ATCC 49924 / DSM 5501 / Z-7288) TaxID=574087 RepID=D9QQB1_ACEAZ|nr:4Fe-4S binding protein [Acetohalobium arabaticum]ADL12702.1 4Fe-4S ferredoxin iron-sulfur binding domain protein [Acetohalobium arabaticum DSM 5501]
MKKRPIIKINEEECNGCGNCVVDCEEGALKIVDGKAKLVNEVFCDGLGDCIGNCPTGALTIEKRAAKEFDPEATEEHVKKMKESSCSCPGSKIKVMNKETEENQDNEVTVKSQLQNWPIQIHLLPSEAPYFENANLLVTADCVPAAYGDYHQQLLKDKIAVMGCPKLDNASSYVNKLSAIIANNNLNSITIARMEVPCCSGLVKIVKEALVEAESNLNIEVVTIGVNGELNK